MHNLPVFLFTLNKEGHIRCGVAVLESDLYHTSIRLIRSPCPFAPLPLFSFIVSPLPRLPSIPHLFFPPCIPGPPFFPSLLSPSCILTPHPSKQCLFILHLHPVYINNVACVRWGQSRKQNATLSRQLRAPRCSDLIWKTRQSDRNSASQWIIQQVRGPAVPLV